MINVDIYTMTGEKKGQIDVSEAVFGVAAHHDLMHRVLVMQLANKRQGTSKTKGRSEVRGGGRRPYRQKGTGRARHGSIRNAQHVGGGVIFGPTPRSYRTRMNKKMRRLALKSALSVSVESKLRVLDVLSFDSMKTKNMIAVLNANELTGSVLVVMDERSAEVERSCSNIRGLKTALVSTINVYDLLRFDHVLMTEAALRKIEEVYA